jgi:hypothetical protein
LKIFIFVVAMGAPIICAQVNFHVAGTRSFIADLQNCITKIRAAFNAGKSRMKNADNFSIQSFQRVTLQSLMLPGRLQQALGWRTIFVAQNIGRDKLRPPGGVEIFRRRGHVLNFLRRMFVKVKPPDKILSASNG